MMVLSGLLAAQGIGFPLSAIAIAVQGLLAGAAPAPQPPEQPRAAIVGRGPGTTVNLSDYLKRLANAALTHAQSPAAQQQRRATLRKRQRMEAEIFALLEP